MHSGVEFQSSISSGGCDVAEDNLKSFIFVRLFVTDVLYCTVLHCTVLYVLYCTVLDGRSSGSFFGSGLLHQRRSR